LPTTPRTLISRPPPYTTLFRSTHEHAAPRGLAPCSRLRGRGGPGVHRHARWYDACGGPTYGNSLRRSVCGPTPSPVTLPFVKSRSEEHTSELQSRVELVCRLLL